MGKGIASIMVITMGCILMLQSSIYPEESKVFHSGLGQMTGPSMGEIIVGSVL